MIEGIDCSRGLEEIGDNLIYNVYMCERAHMQSHGRWTLQLERKRKENKTNEALVNKQRKLPCLILKMDSSTWAKKEGK